MPKKTASRKKTSEKKAAATATKPAEASRAKKTEAQPSFRRVRFSMDEKARLAHQRRRFGAISGFAIAKSVQKLCKDGKLSAKKGEVKLTLESYQMVCEHQKEHEAGRIINERTALRAIEQTEDALDGWQKHPENQELDFQPFWDKLQEARTLMEQVFKPEARERNWRDVEQLAKQAEEDAGLMVSDKIESEIEGLATRLSDAAASGFDDAIRDARALEDPRSRVREMSDICWRMKKIVPPTPEEREARRLRQREARTKKFSNRPELTHHRRQK